MVQADGVTSRYSILFPAGDWPLPPPNRPGDKRRDGGGSQREGERAVVSGVLGGEREGDMTLRLNRTLNVYMRKRESKFTDI